MFMAFNGPFISMCGLCPWVSRILMLYKLQEWSRVSNFTTKISVSHLQISLHNDYCISMATAAFFLEKDLATLETVRENFSHFSPQKWLYEWRLCSGLSGPHKATFSHSPFPTPLKLPAYCNFSLNCIEQYAGLEASVALKRIVFNVFLRCCTVWRP